MNEHTLRVLEFDRVAAIVAGFTASAAGQAAVQVLTPVSDRRLAAARLAETRELLGVLSQGETPPLEGIMDIGPAAAKLSVAGSVLTPVELLHTAVTLGVGRRIRQFFERQRDGRPDLPLLRGLAAGIRPLKHLEDAVHAAVDDQGEVRDSASPELRRIRRYLAQTRDDILKRLTGILQDSGNQKIVQDPVVTMRDDRYVLPLKPNFRMNLSGVVHGQSGSKATLFVEPLAVVEQNNHLAELRMDEQAEIERILRRLTSLLAAEAVAIGDTIAALTAIDAITARARFGLACGGAVPELSDGRTVRLREARHPLLVWKQRTTSGKEVAPNDLDLGGADRALILSGPNAGGKTALLKMIGLLALMAQAGLPITAAEGALLPCFGSIFADIGDEQSLEQDLSTFSAHIGQIGAILREADEGSLVLLDELGAGTDPAEGAGLGAAVLESLLRRGSMTIVTTHHTALKVFGAETPGAVNAAMEFDPRTLRPTYRVLRGLPGRSYGLDMASRSGIPADVIANARQRIGGEDRKLEGLLQQVEESAQSLANERSELAARLKALEQREQDSHQELAQAKQEARETRAQARRDAREVLAGLRQRLRELSRAESLERTAVRELAAEATSLEQRLAPTPADEELVREELPALSPGDRIRIPRLNRTALVLAVHEGQVEIEVGGKKVRMPARDLAPVEPLVRQKQAAAPGWSADLGSDESAPDRLYLIGFRVDDGLAELDRFLDRAGMTGLSSITVIHGIGTGALKRAVTDRLRDHPLVAGMRPGEPAEGGAGVTVAELKK
jgi:DNA mismatch repair protein MutS2